MGWRVELRCLIYEGSVGIGEVVVIESERMSMAIGVYE